MKPFIKPPPPPGARVPVASAAPGTKISPNELTIFGVASTLKDPAERAAFLDKACGSDVALRIRLEEWLAAREPAEAAPVSAPAVHQAAEVARPIHETALAAKDRPDAVALVPMSAMQFAASQQPPRHSPIPWAMATIMAIAVGALAVFFFLERQTREQKEAQAKSALEAKAIAEREREAAAAAANEAKTAASRAEQSRLAAEQGKAAAAAETAQAKAEAERQKTEREQAFAREKAAVEKAQAAAAEVAKLRSEVVAGQRAQALALADSLAKLGGLQVEGRNYTEAETNLRQALQIRSQWKADPWGVVELRSVLGTIMLQKGKDGEALAEFLAAAESIEALGAPQNDADRARGNAASKKVVQFLNISGRRADATDWKRRLDLVLAPRAQ